MKFEAKHFVGPVTLLQGKPNKTAVEIAAGLTARYSDADKDIVAVKYGRNKEFLVKKINNKRLEELRIT